MITLFDIELFAGDWVNFFLMWLSAAILAGTTICLVGILEILSKKG